MGGFTKLGHDSVRATFTVPHALKVRLVGEYLRLAKQTGKLHLQQWLQLIRYTEKGNGAVAVLWHEEILLHMLCPHLDRSIAFVSADPTATFTADLARVMGLDILRPAKTTSDLFTRMEELLFGQGKICAIAIDGPHGPPRVAKRGAVVLAKHAKVPIFPLACRTQTLRRRRTWDQGAYPSLFGEFSFRVGKPVYISPKADRQAITAATANLQNSLNEISVFHR